MELDLSKYGKDFVAEDVEELDEQMQELWDTALEDMINYGDDDTIELSETGWENAASEDGGIYAKEFWVEGLLTSPTGLDIEVGGWISMDLRDIEEGEQPTIYCTLVLKIDDKVVGECQGFQGWYNLSNGNWDLEWGNY